MRVKVRGTGGAKEPSKDTANYKIFSRFIENVNFDVSALDVDRITDDLPSLSVDVSDVPGHPLPDDTFDTLAAAYYTR